MAKLFLIGDEDTVLGFRFSGVRGHVARNAEEARELFRTAVKDEDVSIVIITERIAQQMRPDLEAFTEKESFPFVVEIPDSEGPLPDRKSPSDIIKEAIGISV